jgi:hypothetical protein
MDPYRGNEELQHQWVGLKGSHQVKFSSSYENSMSILAATHNQKNHDMVKMS